MRKPQVETCHVDNHDALFSYYGVLISNECGLRTIIHEPTTATLRLIVYQVHWSGAEIKYMHLSLASKPFIATGYPTPQCIYIRIENLSRYSARAACMLD